MSLLTAAIGCALVCAPSVGALGVYYFQRTPPPSRADAVVLPRGSAMRFRAVDGLSAAPLSWRELSFDDGGWTAGRLPYGFDRAGGAMTMAARCCFLALCSSRFARSRSLARSARADLPSPQFGTAATVALDSLHRVTFNVSDAMIQLSERVNRNFLLWIAVDSALQVHLNGVQLYSNLSESLSYAY